MQSCIFVTVLTNKLKTDELLNTQAASYTAIS